MARVDFYILSDQATREAFTCDLAAKIYLQTLPLYIHASSRDEAVVLDELLWTHADVSFLPHCLVDSEDANTSSITIGWEGMHSNSTQILINLSSTIPDFASDFDRVVEIVPADESYKLQARERYKEYRQAGFEMHNNDLRATNASS